VDGESGCLNAFKKLKRENPHLKVILSVGGSSGSSTFPAFAAQEASRRTFASTSRQVVERYGFDGIDGMSQRLSLDANYKNAHQSQGNIS
jgi:chitinase